MRLYRNESSDPKTNAQRNLMGRTHYVDDDTLRYHKSRVLSSRTVDNGLLFAIVTSDALDHENRKRGYRYVVFDVFGTVVSRAKLEDARRTSVTATKDMWRFLESFDAVAHTREAIESARRYHELELARLSDEVTKIQTQKAAA